ncbi:hypothetical protein I0C86_41800 [Plantactinospora sp. S1510]|uniref:Uncharacterized protein n=1 Tax=Plantactinospora alkalitolerans TaxID=2789879 RepID=A0ABS0HA90_9ACTN|nr:hypothetical protein [Plantactinospora alkalitolerans]
MTPAPAARSAPASGGTAREATQPLSMSAARATAGFGPPDRLGAHSADDRGPAPDRTGERAGPGGPDRAEFRNGTPSDETVLLTTVRNPADEPSQ